MGIAHQSGSVLMVERYQRRRRASDTAESYRRVARTQRSLLYDAIASIVGDARAERFSNENETSTGVSRAVDRLCIGRFGVEHRGRLRRRDSEETPKPTIRQ